MAESGVPATRPAALVADADVANVVRENEELETALCCCCCCCDETAVLVADDTACEVAVDLIWAEVAGDGVLAMAEVAFDEDTGWTVLVSASIAFALAAEVA